MRNRILAMLMAAGVCLGIICSFIPSALAFSDVSDSETAEAVAVLSGMGIVSGYSDGKYHPNDALTRSQFCKLAVLTENHADQLKSSAYRSLFSDVGSGHWALSYVNLAYTEGLVQGYGNGTFGPDDAVTCGQAVTIALRILGYTTDDIGPFWPEDYMEKAAALGLLDGISKGAEQGLSRGEAALLLYHLLQQTNADGQEYLSVYANTTVTAAVVLDNDDTADDGTAGTALVYADGSVKNYEQSYMVDDALVGYRGTLLLDKTGKVMGLVPDENLMKAVAIAEVTSSAIKDSAGNTYTISSSVKLLVDEEETTYGAGWYDLEGLSTVNIFYSDSGSIDLVVATDYDKYEGVTLTGYYESVSPSSSNPATVTLAGATLDVADTALKSIRNFVVGDRITVTLNAVGEIAAAYSTSVKTADMYGILGSGKVTLTNGLVLSGTISGSPDTGMMVRVVSSGIGKLSVSSPTAGNSYRLSVKNGLLGSTALADDVVIYEHVGTKGTAVKISLSDILADTVSSDKIDFVHKNVSGLVDILLLDDVTGDCYTYGLIKTKSVSGGSGTMTYENTYAAVENGNGTTDYYAVGSVNGGMGGIAISDAGEVTGKASLRKVTNISRNSFSGEDFVQVNGTSVPVSDEVQVYNTDSGEWVTLQEAKAYADTFTVYYDRTITTGAQVRLICTQ